MECFISGLKESIQTHVRMHQPTTWLEAFHKALDAETNINAQYSHPSFPSKKHPTLASGPTQTLKVQKVLLEEMAERRRQGLCYYCNDKMQGTKVLLD